MFSYELQRLEMADSLNKIELFFMSVVKFQTIKAALLHEVMRILGLLCLVALPSKILMVLDVHHHGVNVAVSGKGKDRHILPLQPSPRSWLQLAHTSSDSKPDQIYKEGCKM